MSLSFIISVTVMMICGFYFIILGLTKIITDKVLHEQRK
ncbi:hypothetical protein Turpa_4083 [Turneriella parva DSM 21527]|uniref:Uncharacterized protein n=1 Tax=Turneriella parva (strain ATCC BAA-1111 / DSM 21527 / NCTC 11395 / H) TaxID=869212 RepID=I4BBR0_TURPD|nr:hypothetical protein Turpa_4083 [Turneriella parva DSM 21527]